MIPLIQYTLPSIYNRLKSFLLLILLSLFSTPLSELKSQVLTSIAQTGTFFSNPIIATDAPDPSIIDGEDGYYYLFGTGGNVFRSRDCVNWTKLGFAFEKAPSFVPGCNAIWAMDVNKIGDKFVMYFSSSAWGGIEECGIGVAYATKAQGPYKFVTAGGKLFNSAEVGVLNSIDPFYIEDNGQKYLFWGSFHGIYGIALNDDGLSVKEGAKKRQIAGTAYEGTYIYKRNGYYYFFGSTGSCCDGAKSTYKTVYARSKNLFGPYYNKSGGSLLSNKHDILIQGNKEWAGTGHNAEIFEDKNGDTWMPYHAYSKSQPEKGRMVLLDRILWKNNWPYVINSEPSKQSGRPKL